MSGYGSEQRNIPEHLGYHRLRNKPHHSTDYAALNRVNSVHSYLREMVDHRFRGVSTKWLPYYVGHYKWMREF